jgi:uncharacterized protein YecE (DUF72 family)
MGKEGGKGKSYMIGTSGWNYSHWKGKFYPPGLQSRMWLEFYAKEFDTVEVNYSFYRWPSEATMKGWYKRAPEGFKFTMKAPRLITHLKRLVDVESQVSDFYGLGDLLKEKLGCHLFQLPPSFKRTEENVETLKKFLKILDRKKDNAVEFRHKSWWSEDIYGLLKSHGAAFCTVSGLGMPEDIVTGARTAYLRFHGESYSTRYPESEMKKYARIIRGLDVERTYCYFNNDTNAYAIMNARELKSAVAE